MPCTLKNNSFVGDMAIFGGVYLTAEGKCRCGLFPNEHPEPQQLGANILIYSGMKSVEAISSYSRILFFMIRVIGLV